MTFNILCAVAVIFFIIGIICYVKNKTVGRVLLTVGTVAFIFPALFYLWIFTALYFGYAVLQIISGIIVVLAALIILLSIWGAMNKKPIIICTLTAFAVCICAFVGYKSYRSWLSSLPEVSEGNESLLYDYAPDNSAAKTAVLDAPCELEMDSDFPRLDGATALYPVYSAFAKAVYPEQIQCDEGYLTCSKTTGAYEKIVSGEADMIFVAAPSDEQMKYAENSGVELEFTPIGKEAFVFFVNSKNPFENITVDQIKDIYSGRTSKWSQLGVSGLGKIKAYQRNEGSGSQSALIRLMDGTPLAEPMQEDVSGGMGDIIQRVAVYKNHKNALGFSFRFYSTNMVQSNQIKLLSVNGVKPVRENIENGTYPISDDFYAVTRKDKTENTARLLEWIKGAQGKELIEKTGYTAVK